MAGKVKDSKTNVSARRDAKAKKNFCKFCGKEVSVVLAVSSTGKKKFKRLCCESVI